MKYKAKIEGGEFGETEIEASNLEQAEERAREWVREGDYTDFEQEEFVTFTIQDEKGEEWEFQQSVGGPVEPECEEAQEHNWQEPHALVGGGSEENPGVFSESNGQSRFEEVCCNCGRYRTRISASVPSANPQMPERVTYGEPDDESLRWVADLRAPRKRKRG